MKIGSTDIVNCKIGSTQVNEIRIGSTLVWQFSSVDPDAQAFITAAGITNPTQQTAINTLVLSLKANSIWTKMKAIYPFVGGTATSHKFNLKNPLDTNAAFRLVFNGGWTHSATGAKPNGTNAFADSFFIPSTNSSLNSSHLSYYSRTNSNGTEIEIGCFGLIASYYILEIRTSGTSYVLINQPTLTSFADANSLGFYLGNRQAVNDVDGWKNGVKLVNGNQSSFALNSTKIYIGAMNNNGAAGFLSTKECSFSSIGDGLTDTDATNFYTAVQTFNTTLGRQV